MNKIIKNNKKNSKHFSNNQINIKFKYIILIKKMKIIRLIYKTKKLILII